MTEGNRLHQKLLFRKPCELGDVRGLSHGARVLHIAERDTL